ncbi:unnamed protein product, partial [Staurois parvus]
GAFLSPLQLTPGGKAEVACVSVGDWLLQIDGESTTNMTHIEAQNKIRACSNKLGLVLSRFSLGLSNQPKVENIEKSVSIAYCCVSTNICVCVHFYEPLHLIHFVCMLTKTIAAGIRDVIGSSGSYVFLVNMLSKNTRFSMCVTFFALIALV